MLSFVLEVFDDDESPSEGVSQKYRGCVEITVAAAVESDAVKIVDVCLGGEIMSRL